jgi:hypothetical protein
LLLQIQQMGLTRALWKLLVLVERDPRLVVGPLVVLM